MTITSGTEITVGGGFSIGAEGTFQEVISAGVDFECEFSMASPNKKGSTSPSDLFVAIRMLWQRSPSTSCPDHSQVSQRLSQTVQP